MTFTTWTRKQFAELPERKWDEVVYCDVIVIIPMRTKHSSGYRNIQAAAVVAGNPIALLAGGSDVIHIDGIGGFGNWNPANGIPASVPVAGWQMDCLPVSGYMCLWPSNHAYQIRVGIALSSLEIFAVKRTS